MATKKISANEKHLQMLYALSKRRESLAIANKNTHFKDTELRLLAEIVQAKNEGERLISTQLATRLGVTRSAISQIVNRLEERGIVKRVDDEVDRKIAYIELTEDIVELYKEDLQQYLQQIGAIVSEFGEERFTLMCDMLEEFNRLTQDRLKRAKKKS
jgi:DNA-binding MarR family transcriptional regulator